MKLFYIIALILATFFNKIQVFSQTIIWARTQGGIGSEQGNRILATDNLYITGLFGSNFCYFDSSNYLSPRDGADMFIAKYSKTGQLSWAKGFGGNNSPLSFCERIHDIIQNKATKDLYITGTYQDSLFFGSFNLPGMIGDSDLFFAKLDTNGNFIWAIRGHSASKDDGKSMDIDSAGNLYLSASFGDTGVIAGINVQKGIVLTKFESSGNCLWAKPIGSNLYDAYIKYKNNNIYACGSSEGLVDTFWVDTIPLINNGFTDVFISKFDTSGNAIWAKRIGWTGIELAGDLIVDDSSNLFVPIYYRDSTIIGNDTLRLPHLSLVKFDPNGNLLWQKNIDSYNGGVVKLDTQGNLYLMVGSEDTLHVEGSTFYPIGIDGGSVIAKFNSSGSLLDIDQISSSGTLDIDNLDNIFIVGTMKADIVTATGIIHASAGGPDSYVAMHEVMTGEDEIERKSMDKLFIYANPTTGLCNITIPEELNNSKNLELKLFDNQGRLIRQYPVELNNGTIRINLEEEAKGMFNIILSNGTKNYTGKIIFE